MTLRIFEQATEGKGGKGVIALHGWLSAAEVSELEGLAAAHSGAVTIDLTHLAGVDAEGIKSLRRLQDRGARVAGATPFVALLLERASQSGE
jgi:hypothetical protein